MLSLISAVSTNGTIGLNNNLPWHISADLKYFKAMTMGKPMIMGRTTFETFPKPLPGRAHIILTRDKNYADKVAQYDECHVVHSLEESLALAASLMTEFAAEDAEAFVVGGAEIYSLFFDHVQRMYLTEVAATVEGDTFFPEYNKQQWNELSRENHLGAESASKYDFSFAVYEKVA
ncbi:MAG: dihydrofolate reductase [Gammaproteobacteria bacterium]|nr:MAG: dihydrofolate reductase [Gammaproteobacteria bacterium]